MPDEIGSWSPSSEGLRDSSGLPGLCEFEPDDGPK